MVEILKLVIMAAACLIAYTIRADVIPFIRQKMTAEQFKAAQEMAEMFV